MAIGHDVDERTDRIIHHKLGCFFSPFSRRSSGLCRLEGIGGSNSCDWFEHIIYLQNQGLASRLHRFLLFFSVYPDPELDSLSASELESLSELELELSSF